VLYVTMVYEPYRGAARRTVIPDNIPLHLDVAPYRTSGERLVRRISCRRPPSPGGGYRDIYYGSGTIRYRRA